MNLFLSILSGGLLILSYNLDFFWWVSFFALIPLLYLIYNTENLKKVFGYAYLSGFVYLFGAFFWLLSTYPIVWIKLENEFFNFLIVLVTWFLIPFVLSFVFGFFAIIFCKLKSNKIQDVYLISTLWIVFEFIRIWIYSLGSYSPESLLGSHYTFALLGYNLANSNFLIQLAGVGGVYLLSFIVVFVNAILFFIFKNRNNIFSLNYFNIKNILKINKSLIFLIIFIFIILIYANFLNSKLEESKILNVSLLQTKFLSFSSENNDKNKLERNEIYKDILFAIKNKEPQTDIILFPEGTDFVLDLMKKEQDESFYNNLFSGKEILIIDSAFVRDSYGKAKSKMYFYNTKNQDYNIYEKQLLAQNGETMPELIKVLMKVFGLSEWIDYFKKNKSYTKSNQEEIGLGLYNNSNIGVVFCSEIFSPILFQDLVFQKAELVGLSASYATFRGSQLLLSQFEKVAKVRAVETNRYFIQSSNYGHSLVIDNKGSIVAKTEDLDNGYLTYPVELVEKNSFYTYLGDWILWFSGLFLILYIYFFQKSNPLSLVA